MQVEYKTEKGTVLFVKTLGIPTGIDICEDKVWYRYFNEDGERDSSAFMLPSKGFNLFGLTSEIKEDKLTKIFNPKIGILYEMFGYDYLTSDVRNTFKSLMQHLQVYEVNPYGESLGFDYIKVNLFEITKMELNWLKAKSITGKWIVLFKAN